MDRDIPIQLRVRRTGQHLDMMTEVGKRAAQLLEVNALAAAVGIAAVREKTDAKRSVHDHPVSLSLRCRRPIRPLAVKRTLSPYQK
jgi:hypothetical protein